MSDSTITTKRPIKRKHIIDAIRKHGGQITTKEVLDLGYSSDALYNLLYEGAIEEISRGIYRMTDIEPLSEPDLVTVALRAPKAVFCLISALSFHEITTQIPREVSFALPQGAWTPQIDYPPISVYHFSESSYNAGIEKHLIDGTDVYIYSVEKTLADCFKFRNKLGMDIVLEAPKLYREDKPFKSDKLYEYSKICRVRKIMKPYLEATL